MWTVLQESPNNDTNSNSGLTRGNVAQPPVFLSKNSSFLTLHSSKITGTRNAATLPYAWEQIQRTATAQGEHQCRTDTQHRAKHRLSGLPHAPQASVRLVRSGEGSSTALQAQFRLSSSSATALMAVSLKALVKKILKAHLCELLATSDSSI